MIDCNCVIFIVVMGIELFFGPNFIEPTAGKSSKIRGKSKGARKIDQRNQGGLFARTAHYKDENCANVSKKLPTGAQV